MVTGSLWPSGTTSTSGRKAILCKNRAMTSSSTTPAPSAPQTTATDRPWTSPAPTLPDGRRRHRVAVLVLEGAVAFEIGLPHRFLTTGPTLAGWPGPTDGLSGYDTVVCTVGDRPVMTSAGFSVVPTVSSTSLAQADTVVIPGFTHQNPVRTTGRLDPEVRTLLATARSDVRWMSICTGAFALAAAGLLDGRRATTHWAHADDFSRLFPGVRLDPSVLFVDEEASGNRPRVVTAAGNAAGIDALLHLVRSDHGSATANTVARSAVVAPWRDGGQAQFIERVLPTGPADATLEPTRRWALGQLASGVDLPMLADHAGVSVRTFTRRFREETGETAGRWLTRARTDLARNLLEDSDLGIERVAARAGFGTTAALRLNLAAETGLSPVAYRRRFRAAAGG